MTSDKRNSFLKRGLRGDFIKDKKKENKNRSLKEFSKKEQRKAYCLNCAKEVYFDDFERCPKCHGKV